MAENTNTNAEKKILTRSKKRLIFYILMVVFPVLQFAIFYIYTNFNVILMAFQKYSVAADGLGYDMKYVFLDNFSSVFAILKKENGGEMVGTSVLMYAISIFISTPLALFFSYYLYKKFALSGFFKTILFMPQVLSSVVLVILFEYMVTDVYVSLTGAEFGLLDVVDTKLITILFFNVWISFGANVLIYTGSMSGISESIVESAKLDGASGLREFIYITMPMIFPTFATFFVAGIAGIFTNQMHLYTFYENNSSIRTVGYYLYVQTLNSGLVSNTHVSQNIVWMSFPEISAFGLMIMIVVFPLTIIVRKLFNKYGPSVE